MSADLARPGYRVREQFGGERVSTTSTPGPHPTPLGAGSSPAAAPGTSKYHAKPTNGYASKREAKRAAELQALERAGRISNLREQVKFLLIPAAKDANGKTIERACSYFADFVYNDERGYPVVEDAKGARTRDYVIKRKLMYMVHGVRVRES